MLRVSTDPRADAIKFKLKIDCFYELDIKFQLPIKSAEQNLMKPNERWRLEFERKLPLNVVLSTRASQYVHRIGKKTYSYFL